uniref:Uncharacterized protein n=1 Tax=Arundo donax TaxID=35708 RepID=A0A0A9D6H8_ARUDO
MRIGARRGGGHEQHLPLERELPLQLPLQPAASAAANRALLLLPLLRRVDLHRLKRRGGFGLVVG